MSRFSRINTIWRKELADTLRDRRTVIAMVLVPMVLYPALMLGSLQAFEAQIASLKGERYTVVVPDEATSVWLRNLLDTDVARRPGAENKSAEELQAAEAKREPVDASETQPADASVARAAPPDGSAVERARTDIYSRPPDYDIVVVDGDLERLVLDGRAHLAIAIDGPLPALDGANPEPVKVKVWYDRSDPRSGMIAVAGLDGVLDRARVAMLQKRLARVGLTTSFLSPIQMAQIDVAPPERVSGSIIGQIVPLILIIMTITGAIYPAIDLTAGERERGTLETLMVAPVPTIDLIAGKFVVVTLIGMLSATLNLISIGGTIYLGGLGELLTRGQELVIPLRVLPLVLLVLVPLAVMFSAMLLAVCSFARSFKEAQNYVMPVMMAALIPAVVGVLPGARLVGPMLIMPVANIVILTRDLFTGRIDPSAITWVLLSTSLYAAAAVAVAAKLFGQEAVLFADSGSIKTVFQRRFFKPAKVPSAASALLLMAIVFSLNFFLQQSLLHTPGLPGTIGHFVGAAILIAMLYYILPLATAIYMRVSVSSAFAVRRPPPLSIVAALCFGFSTWILVSAYFEWQKTWLPIPPEMMAELERLGAVLSTANLVLVVLLVAVIPALCEEFFFRGYSLSGLRAAVGAPAAVLITSLAFGIHHHSSMRLVQTALLGVLLALLVLRWGSIVPAMIAHLMHNGIAVLSQRSDGLAPLLEQLGYVKTPSGYPPTLWIIAAAALTGVGIGLCLIPRSKPAKEPDLAADAPPVSA